MIKENILLFELWGPIINCTAREFDIDLFSKLKSDRLFDYL